MSTIILQGLRSKLLVTQGYEFGTPPPPSLSTGIAAEIFLQSMMSLRTEQDTGRKRVAKEADTGVRELLALQIPVGATGLSAGIDIGGYRLVGIEIPSDWIAASITFQAWSNQIRAFQNLYDDAGVEVTAVVAASHSIAFRSDLTLALASYRLIKLRSGTGSVPVSQTNSPTLGLVLLPIG